MRNTGGHGMGSTMNGIKDIMTEDNTFNALKRTPLNQMYDLWRGGARFSGFAPPKFYEQHGWTHAEFWAEYNKRLND
jgi:hypothetical protein